jgi:hypothetical protein
MARRRKNGRFTKSTRRRRSKPKTNLTNLAVSALVANTITTGMFNSNIVDFATGRQDGVYRAGADGSTRLTLPELLGVGSVKLGGNYGGSYDLQSVLKKNFKENWATMAVGVILIPVAAKTITKLIRKPVILPANRMLKSVGLDVKV